MRLPSLSLERRRTVLGMDIGTDGVRLVEAHKHGDRYTIEWAEEVSLTELQGFADYDSVAERLASVLGPRLKDRVEIATVPPWNSAHVAIEEMPAMDATRFHQATQWHFRNNPQDDMLDPVHRGILQPARPGANDHDVIDGVMVSLDQVMLTGLVEMCRSLGLRLQWLLPTPLCTPALLRVLGDAQGRALYLDVGASQTRMTLAMGGAVRLVRKLKPSTTDVIRAIGEQLEIDWVSSHHALLARSGLGPLASADPEGVAARAEPVIDASIEQLAQTLRGEILRSTAYVEARHGERVERVLVGGGLAGSPLFLERLGEDLGLPLHAADPFATSDDASAPPVAARPRFAMAMGASVLALEKRQAFDLLGEDKAPAPEPRAGTSRRALPVPRLVAAGIALAAIGGVAAVDTGVTREIGALEDARTRLEEEQIELRVRAHELTAREDLFAIEDRIESLRGIYQSRRLITPFFTQVVDCLPEAARLDHVSIERSRSRADEGGAAPLAILLNGRTRDVDAVGGFVVGLEERGLLARIEVLRINEQKDDARDRWFTFVLRGEPVVLSQQDFIAANETPDDPSDPEVAR